MARFICLEEIADAKPPMLFADARDVMSVRDAAELLDVSTRTLYRAIERGELQAAKIGSCVRISKTALLRFLGEQ